MDRALLYGPAGAAPLYDIRRLFMRASGDSRIVDLPTRIQVGPKMKTRSPLQTDVIVGRNIRTRRTQVQMSQLTLANHLGLTFQQIQKYEKGLNRIGASRLMQIAEVLGVSIQTLFAGVKGLNTSASASLDYRFDALTVRLARSYANVDEGALRRSIVKLVEEIAECERRKKTNRARSRKET